MTDFFQTVLVTSLHGSIVILAVLLLRLVLKKAPKKFINLLWMLAGIRLLLPIPIESAFSLQPASISFTLPQGLVPVLTGVWLALAAAIGIYSVAAYIHLRRKVLDAVRIPGGWESDKIETAFVLGFVKPKIYIPTGMSRDVRKQILAHERTHLDKGDHWIKMIGFLALALHWFNPLVWVSYVLLCKDMEMACDERVVQFMELEERKAYSTALLQCSTNRPHYAACPVAFGEVSVKYRIKSILNYRKPSFWLSLLGVLAFLFVSVCLLTNPREAVEVPVDPDEPLRQMSAEDPAAFVPEALPESEPNPDWGVRMFMDASATTGGTLVFAVEERFAAVSDTITFRDNYLERWNGSAWEALPSRSGDTSVFPGYRIGFAQRRDAEVNYFEEPCDWTLNYGSLSAGIYRVCVTVDSVSDSAQFRAPFRIYREELPSDQEAALERCETALAELTKSTGYSVLFSQTAPDGEVYPMKRITSSGGQQRIDHYLGEYCVSSAVVDGVHFQSADWDLPFRLNGNRQYLFPEGSSVISQSEVTFCSVWADYSGTSYRGMDTYRFYEDGSLMSVTRKTETLDENGNVTATFVRAMESEKPESLMGFGNYISNVGSYAIQDAFDAQQNSPWSIFFRVDDDLLNPGSGEVWLAVDAIGISNYSTDGSYWLERKVGSSWERLGGEDKTASWASETIKLTGQTEIRQADWSADYGQLEAGVYRMGKHFYKGDESIIQYAEFAIYQTGGVFGAGGEAAMARVDAAIADIQSGNYRVVKLEPSYSDYGTEIRMTEIHWKYGDTMVVDFYNDVEDYSHSVVEKPGDIFYGLWCERDYFESEYDCVWFPQGYGLISDREIRFAYGYSQTSAENPCTLYTYRFDENGRLTEIIHERLDGMWSGYRTRYVVTQTPEEEIQKYVEQKQAEQ